MKCQWTALVVALIAAPAWAAETDQYRSRFEELRGELRDPANGYFSQDGIPYHAPETLLIEAPDYGHETTSEAYSYWLWLEAMHGRFSGDWNALGEAWTSLEKSMIPGTTDQPTNGFYTPGHPATYASEWPTPQQYPSALDAGVTPGADPIGDELARTYGTHEVYGMHWLLDVDNWYGFGQRGDGTSAPSLMNTFQRGPQESVWETVPHPSWDTFRFGGPNGYLNLFVGDQSYARQWRYTDAPDADARVVQVLHRAAEWATARGQDPATVLPLAKGARMGDFLRYSLFDKYFKTVGCQSPSCAPGVDRSSAHYLLGWYYAWGGAADPSAGWAWRIGSSHAHFGYQNPMAAWALANDARLRPASPTAAADWQVSLGRQVDLYEWLQSSEGAIAGGATNSWEGRYGAFPKDTATFHGMAYDEQPVYHDPASNSWFGWQAWSMQRLAEYYHSTGDVKAGRVLEKWVAWVERETQLEGDGYAIPATLAWAGQPETWTGEAPANAALHVSVVDRTQDIGVTASLARTLTWYAAARGVHAGAVDGAARDLARELLDRMWAKYRDAKGVSVEEARADYSRIFDQAVHVPEGFQGAMPNGDRIEPGVTFLGLRSKYRSDPAFAEVERAVQEGRAPTFHYHRFWAQAEVALANGDFSLLFGNEAAVTGPTIRLTSPADGATFVAPAQLLVQAEATAGSSPVVRVEFTANDVSLGVVNAAPYALDWKDVGDGTYSVTAKAVDQAGRSANTTAVFTVGKGGAGVVDPGKITPVADAGCGCVGMPAGSLGIVAIAGLGLRRRGRG